MIGVSKAEERECGTENNILRNVHGAATIENGMDVLQNLTTELPYGPVIQLLGIYPKELEPVSRGDICTLMFTVALSIIFKRWEQPKRLPTDEWIKKMWYRHTMDIIQP